ncbi:MAG: orotate phosphoribosyltransferase [Pseudomonadales bacterium]|jgi:orotate phosphoribosyltransferase|nr:orotate phosphoribosyltransferase [Pseudomonadales bacterium]
MQDYQRNFLDFVIARNILRFGDFTLKSGRQSPYFFNAGLFNTGEALAFIGHCYAAAIAQAALPWDVLFGPAYKGIPLVSSTSVALARDFARDAPYCFNRKEAKDHGEGGSIVGAPLTGRVLVIDDVITAGTAIREVMTLIAQHQAQAAGVVVALDRQERGQGELSAIGEIRKQYGIAVLSIISLDQIIVYLERTGSKELEQYLPKLKEYRARYGAD